MKIRNLNKRKTLKESVEDMSKSDLIGAYGRPDYVTAVGEINKKKEDKKLNKYFPNNTDDKEYKAEGDRYFISGRKEDDKVMKHLGITEGRKSKKHLSKINEDYTEMDLDIPGFDYKITNVFEDEGHTGWNVVYSWNGDDIVEIEVWDDGNYVTVENLYAPNLLNGTYETFRSFSDDLAYKVRKHMNRVHFNESTNKNKGHLNKLNEEFIHPDIYRTVIRYFNYSGTSEFMDIIADLVDRALGRDSGDTYEDVYDAIDKGLHQYNDKWQVISHYETPEISEETYEELANDLVSIIDELREDEDDEDFEEGLTKKNIRESYLKVASIGNDEGPIYTVYYGGFDSFDSLVPVEDENGNRIRLHMYDVMNDYYWYDKDGNIIHEPNYEDEDFEESFKSKKNFKNNKRFTRG